MHERLKYMALEALEQVCSESRQGAAPKTRALAFSLAYLWTISDGQKWRYDGFWQAATGYPEQYSGWSRSTNVTRFLNGIYHSLGMARTAEIQILFDAMYQPDNNEGMCNHYRNYAEFLQNWEEYIGWNLPSAHIEYAQEVWPKRQGLIIRETSGKKVADTMQWGVPLKMKGKRQGTTITKRITNVRNLKSNFWRSTLSTPAQRCLVPFNQFAEPKPNAGREEVWFKVNEKPVSAFAGIWRETDEGNAYAFLTCEPNPLVKPIHPKAMPVVLHPEDYKRWLAGEDAEQFAVPFPSQLMSLVE